jgi:hypothetical protein
MKDRKVWTIILMLSLVSVSVSLSGCVTAEKFVAPCGATDFGYLPKGTKIANVPLPTDELNEDGTNKNYTLVIPKDSFWMSKECDARMS